MQLAAQLKTCGITALHPFSTEGSCTPTTELFLRQDLQNASKCCPCLASPSAFSVLCTLTTHASAPKAPGRCFWAGCAVPLSCAEPWQTPDPAPPVQALGHALHWSKGSAAGLAQPHPAPAHLLMFTSIFYCQSPHLGRSLLTADKISLKQQKA